MLKSSLLRVLIGLDKPNYSIIVIFTLSIKNINLNTRKTCQRRKSLLMDSEE